MEQRETILLVEDEPAVRQLFCLALTRAGYRVHDARTGRLLRTSPIPLGSYNVDRGGGGAQAVTPSLDRGTLCVTDPRGRVVRRLRVARSSHDACVVVTP